MFNTIYGREIYNMTFCDVFRDAPAFIAAYKASGVHTSNNKISDDSAGVLYYLLYSRYGNSTIASNDPERFKYSVFSIVYIYGPTWEKMIDLQNKIRSLTDAEIAAGATTINNHAYNPETAPTTSTTEELQYINEQHTQKTKRSKVEAYGYYLSLLNDDFTDIFLKKFAKLFKAIVQPDVPIIMETPNEQIDYLEEGFNYGMD